MKATSKHVLGALVASTLVLGAGGLAYARGGYGPGCYGGGPAMGQGMMGAPAGQYGCMGGPKGQMGGRMGAMDPAVAAQRLEQLKTSLGITAEQQQAWDTYATALTARATMMNEHRQARFDGTLTPAKLQELREAGLSQQVEMATARRDLYAALTPEQRANAGQWLLGPGGRGGRW